MPILAFPWLNLSGKEKGWIGGSKDSNVKYSLLIRALNNYPYSKLVDHIIYLGEGNN
jgi:hypothetical protein